MKRSKNWLQKNKSIVILSLLAVLGSKSYVAAQESNGGVLPQIHGNFQIDTQYYNTDSAINAIAPEERMLMNGFSNLNYSYGKFSAGIRYEAYLNALQGFLPGYRGTGIPYRFAQYKEENLDVTIGSFYEQFGSGLILRAYEERNLGYDNAFDGFRVKFNPHKGVYLKGIYGKQRIFFDKSPGIVRGIDGEVSINELLDSALAGVKTRVTIGGSFVSRYQDPTDVTYRLPANVGSWAARMDVLRGGFRVNGEYVYKINDPSRDNGYIYRQGQGFIVNASYSTKGLGIVLSGKAVDNMSFRSDRNEGFQNLFINFNPALTKPHSYNLAATLYPYATQPTGEVALQGEISYKINKGLIGGKYGTQITLNASMANGLDSTQIADIDDPGRQGYSSPLFSFGGQKYFRDINVEIRRKLSKNWKIVLMYLNLEYNMEVIQGRGGKGTVYADIFIADINWKINKKHNLRFEMQGLRTNQDQGSWVTGLVEYSVSPKYFLAVLNQYNLGNEKFEPTNYPYVTAGYIRGANRISLGYGRQRAGLFCVGGVCRPVPAANGLTLSITSSF